ncbi:tyrosine-type recombinase/integrase [Rariglobus hedericola]|uniref:Site-specific integrase n=1 Tax=Rariglobus hedericola TaxID=2597822 RepID=A0A556QJG8_9BACT|nr:tyrosine-type recombinase/integrase [Rariglobus hedericola]TSJ76778.1 site-specific integrase [Rariglobus hedericola]
MASVWKHPESRYWVACYTDDGGRQRKRSTKLTDRGKALQMAQKFEGAYRTKLTEAQARKVISDIFTDIHGDKLNHSSVTAFMKAWLEGKRVETSKGSHKRYENAVDKLLAFLGERAERDIAYITKKDLTDLRDATAKTLSISTANTDLKILRIAFKQAVTDGLRLDNPGAAVSVLEDRKDADAPERRPFTMEEIEKLLAVAKGEWRGLILGGLYLGQRLGDLANLTGRKVDMKEGLVSFRSQKTGRDMVIPIAAPLLAELKKHYPSNLDAPIFPKAHESKRDSDGESRRLSAEFHALLVKAKLAEERSKIKNTGRGHSVKRTVSPLSFHSLRHTATSMLKRAGVPESVVRDIIGHESEIVSRNYTHTDDETKRQAVSRLPGIGGA